MTPNTDHNADIVITKNIGGYVIWKSDDVIANTNEEGKNLVISGAASNRLSVWNDYTGQFECGSLDQLVNHSEVRAA